MFKKEKIVRFFEIFHSLEISWQLYTLLTAFLVIIIISFLNDWKIGLLLIVFLLACLFMIFLNMENFINNINIMANDLSKEIKESNIEVYNKSPLSILFYDERKRVRWLNMSMQQVFGKMEVLGENISKLNSEIHHILSVPNDKQWHTIKYYTDYFKVLHQEDIGRIYMVDVSDEMAIKEQRKNDKLVFGYLLLDDYYEVMESLNDQEEANFDANLLKEINYWTNRYGIYGKRIDDEKFILLMNLATLDSLEQDKFNFFDELKKNTSLKNSFVSISIGIAYPEESETDYQISALSKQAQKNLELALARGGDQIVIKSASGKARFYGGKSQQIQKRSNIRAKLIFQAFKNQLEQYDNVLITGHKTPDLDSIGSALGMYRLVKQNNKPVKIIVNQEKFNPDVKELISLSKHLNFSEIFVSPQAAKALISKKTLLLMVDHNKPSLSEGEELIGKVEVMIIDHHRRGEEFPANVVLSYIEPYASSTAELITEFFMNMKSHKDGISAFEATALLSGIMVDTNNFSFRTGSKTFDTASYLKSKGADIDQIQILQKEDFTDIKIRNQIVEQMVTIDQYGIAKANPNKITDNIIASQAADLMLRVKGIEASFVIYKRNEDTIGISARSLGNTNVQVIMEKMGGGGHLSNAATQIKNSTIDQVFDQLNQEIKFVLEEKT